jgi:hypothetical protein
VERSEYLNGVNEFMYQGEVLGEALLDCYARLEQDPERKYKWATLGQLESETRTRLRPFVIQLGLNIAWNDVSARVAKFAESYAAKSWHRHMEEVIAITDIYLEKFRAIAAASPQSERETTQSMVAHESAIRTFAELELAGDGANSLNDVIAQLRYPLTPPSK